MPLSLAVFARNIVLEKALPPAIPLQYKTTPCQLFSLSVISELGGDGEQEGTPPWWRDQLLITSEGEIGVTSSGESGIGGPTPSCVLSFDEESLSGKQLSLLNLAIIPLAKAKIRCEGRTFFNKKKNDKTFDGYFSLYQNLDPQSPNFIAWPTAGISLNEFRSPLS